jgi:hypothetical protein
MQEVGSENDIVADRWVEGKGGENTRKRSKNKKKWEKGGLGDW